MERVFNIDFNISLIDIGGISKGNFWMGGSSSWTWNCLLETAFRRQSSKETLYVQTVEAGIWRQHMAQNFVAAGKIAIRNPDPGGIPSRKSGIGRRRKFGAICSVI